MSTALVRPPLSPWADWETKIKFAEQLRLTGFLPAAIKTPAQVLAIIFTGQEIGIPPMHALRSIDVIEGKPALSAKLKLALFKQRGGRHQWKQSTDEIAILWLRHPNGDEHVETFTLDDAKRAKLTGKINWMSYPKAMLRARCTSAGLDAIAPDITAGLYDPDELGADDVPDDINIVDLGDAPEAPDPPVTSDPAPAATPVTLEDWKREIKDATVETLPHVWADVSEAERWKAWTTPQQVELIADKNAAKRRLGIG